MPATRSRRLRSSAVAGALSLALLAAACGGGDPAAAPSTSGPATADGPAEPGAAPEATTAPAGRTFAVGEQPEGLVVGSTGVAAVAVRNPDAVLLVDLASGRVTRTVPTEGSARHLELATPQGPVLVPLEQTDSVEEIALADGTVTNRATGVGRNPHDVGQAEDGTTVVANELGGGVIFLRDGIQVASLPPGPVQPGGVAITGNYATLSDVRGLGVFVYDVATRTQVAQAPIGEQLTHTISLARRGDPVGTGPTQGVVAVADTVGGAVFLLRITPEVQQVARVDAPGRPYGLAFDPERNLLLTTLTADNLLRVVDVSDPANPRTLGDLPTVTQPNSVAVDPTTGDVVVTGTTDGVLQVIPAAELPRA